MVKYFFIWKVDIFCNIDFSVGSVNNFCQNFWGAIQNCSNFKKFFMPRVLKIFRSNLRKIAISFSMLILSLWVSITFVRTLEVLPKTADRTAVKNLLSKIFHASSVRNFSIRPTKNRDIFSNVGSIALSVNNFRQNSWGATQNCQQNCCNFQSNNFSTVKFKACCVKS